MEFLINIRTFFISAEYACVIIITVFLCPESCLKVCTFVVQPQTFKIRQGLAFMKLEEVLFHQWKNMPDPNKQARLCPHSDM